MMQMRKKTLDRATETIISKAAAAGTPLAFDRYEDMSPVCRFGQMGLDCKACTQGPCRINPFDASNGTVCGRDRESIVAASFLALVADGAAVNASFAGAQSQAAGAIFEGITLANEGSATSGQMLAKAIEVAGAGFAALAAAKADGAPPREVQVGLGTLKADKINILLIGSIPAGQAQAIAAELGSNPRVNLVAATGGEIAGTAIAGNYNSQETILVTTSVDGVVAGKACVSPGFLTLAAKQGVPVMDAGSFDAAALMEAAYAHFRMNQGRNLAERLPTTPAITGFAASTFAGLSSAEWGKLAAMGVQGVALMGGCNNVATTQDAAVVRQAGELLKNDVLVVASGCAAVALAKAGYMNPAQPASLAGKKLGAFLAALSQASGLAVPAVLEAGTCWELPSALELVQLLQKELGVPVAGSMPEVSRPASWSSALALAAQGVPTYVGPILPLDGGLDSVSSLNGLLKARGGALMGPAQVSSPEAVVNLILRAE